MTTNNFEIMKPNALAIQELVRCIISLTTFGNAATVEELVQAHFYMLDNMPDDDMDDIHKSINVGKCLWHLAEAISEAQPCPSCQSRIHENGYCRNCGTKI